HDADFGPAHVRRIFSHALVAPRTGNPDSVQRMTNAQTDVSMPGLTPMQWAICITAAIGFAFDSYVLLMLPLIVRPALVELLKVAPGSPAIKDWAGLIFYVPAVTGGIFGLLGGYFTDLFGRRRVLVWSILLYAFSALASG